MSLEQIRANLAKLKEEEKKAKEVIEAAMNSELAEIAERLNVIVETLEIKMGTRSYARKMTLQELRGFLYRRESDAHNKFYEDW